MGSLMRVALHGRFHPGKARFFVRIMSITERSEHVLIPNHIVMIAVMNLKSLTQTALAKLKQPSRQKINPCLEICQIAFFTQRDN